jgi:hypothetical protein
MSAVAKAWCQRYAINHIGLDMQPGVVDSADSVCNLLLKFEPGYQVEFKLLGEHARLGEKITAISADGSVSAATDSATGNLEEDLSVFFASIESRLDRIEHEEKVQSITFLGNTFVLNNKTVFDVVSDDDGRLTIEMHRGDKRQSAMLLASSLLDGLYDGSIALKSG